jgi:hypothetical protein
MKQLDYKGRFLAKFFFVPNPAGYKIEVIHHHGRDRI